MLLEKVNEIPVSRTMVSVFRGYNHNLRIAENEFYHMTNLSSDHYPVLSPRRARGIYVAEGAPTGLISKDGLCYVDGEDFICGGERVPLGLSPEPKTLVSMGAYVIIMPDKKYINTIDTNDKGDIEAAVETEGEVSFTLCRADGSAFGETSVGEEAPESPTNTALWIDTSSVPHVLRQYSSAEASWGAVATTYIRISATGIGLSFKEGDGIAVSGVSDEALSNLNGTMILEARGDDYLVVTGILDQVTTQSTPITVKRQMPNLDFIIESGNRLWGCRYGEALNGEIVNEIYASKLGDFKNWNCFTGISTDSYTATVGSDGPFTGAIEHLGYPIFFKEACMHKVYGSYPANYRVQSTACRGVQKGCERSLAIVGEVLYYKARTGVCAYDGSLPAEISAVFGEENYYYAAAGALGNKYYISMADEMGKWHLFVYDAAKGLWHREDDTQAVCFCRSRGDLFYIDYADKYIKSVRGTGVPESKPIKWEAVSGIIGTDSPDKKYVSRMDVRMSLGAGARVSFYAEYNSSGEWEYLFTMDGINLETFAVPIKAKRCDHMRIRIVGTGAANIFSICKTMEQGSDG